jgi:adenylate kinase family enzyme
MNSPIGILTFICVLYIIFVQICKSQENLYDWNTETDRRTLIAAMSPGPGAGKSTTFGILSELTGFPRRSQDMERRIASRPAHLKSIIRSFKNGNTVLSDKLNATISSREDYINIKKNMKNKQNVKLDTIWVQFINVNSNMYDETALKEECLNRACSRGDGHEGFHKIKRNNTSRAEMKKYVEKFFDRYKPLSDYEKSDALAVIDIDIMEPSVVQVQKILKVLNDNSIYTTPHSVEEITNVHEKIISQEAKRKKHNTGSMRIPKYITTVAKNEVYDALTLR